MKAGFRSVVWLLAVLVTALPVPAATSYTWTNTTLSFWTNSINWSPSASTPGAAAGDSAYLTNSIAVSYTNILDFKLGNTLSTLAISNTLGEAWLVVTNTTLTNTTFALGTGGRLQVDAGGVVTGITSFSWTGTGGAIHLNAGKLFTAGAVALGVGSVTGNGGVWNLNAGALTISNALTVTGGAVVTNIGNLSLPGNQQSLSGTVFGKGSVIFAATAGQFGNTINLGTGAWDLNAGSLTVGSANNASNHTFVGGLVTNASGLYVGGFTVATTGNNHNTVLFTNTGSGFIMSSAGNIEIGSGTGNNQSGGHNNLVILSNSFLWSAAGGTYANIGSGSSNNVLTLLTNTTWNVGTAPLIIGGNLNVVSLPGTNNALNITGALVTNAGIVYVGGNGVPNALSNRLVITEGGILSNFAGLYVGNAAGANFNSVIATSNAKVFMSSGPVTIGGAGGNFNTVWLSNAVLRSTTGNYVGNYSTNNSLTLLNSTWNLGNAGLTVGAGAITSVGGANNSATFHNSVISNVGTLSIGYAAGASNNQVLAIGSVLSNVTALWVGLGYQLGPTGFSVNNSLIVTGSGAGLFMTSAGGIGFGAAANQQAGGVNTTVILTNSVLWGNGTVNVGGQTSTNNHATLLGTSWNNGNAALYIGGWGNFGGPTTGGLSNSLTLRGAVLSNFTIIGVGYLPGAAGNRLLIQDGSILSNNAGLYVGYSAGADGNTVIATNGGRLAMTNGAFYVGNGGSGNTVILSNSFLKTNAAGSIGNNGSNNTVTLLAGTVWNNGNVNLVLGNGVGAGNILTLDSAIVSNVGSLTIGGATGSSSNQLILRNGSVLSNITGTLGAFVVGGAPGANYNSLIASNGSVIMTGAGRIGIGATTLGAGGSYNTVILSNSVLLGSFVTCIGYNGTTNNSLTLLGNSVLNNGGAVALNIGGYNAGNAVGNSLTIDSSLVTNVTSGLSVGYGSGSYSNQVIITAGGVLSNVSVVTIGNTGGAYWNSLHITNGGQLYATTSVQAGTGGGSNSIRVVAGSLLEANSLLIGAGTGNTISNVAGTYQFTTNAPTITPLVFGNIALTDGTLSYRAITNANIFAPAVTNIAFAGNNTYRLNAASNTTLIVQTYTFHTGTNYTRLELINGHTAYRNGNVTIGAAGSFLASNTIATITGTFTNNGLADIIDSTVNFTNALHIGGTLTLRNGYVTGAGAKTIAGTIAGNGSVVGNVSISGAVAPGLSPGTLVFSNNLTLTGSYQADFGDSGNDQLIVVGTLTLSGATLNLTQLGGATSNAFVIASYGTLAGDGAFTTTTGLPSGYTIDCNYNAANQIAIVAVPEPATLGLVGLGLVAMIVAARTRRKSRCSGS